MFKTYPTSQPSLVLFLRFDTVAFYSYMGV